MVETPEQDGSKLGRFILELNRRHVTGTAAIYTVAGLAVIEFTNNVFPVFGFGEGAERAVILLVLVGFPVSLILSWWFEIGEHGIRRRPRVIGLRRFAAATLALAVVAMGLAGLGLRGRIAGTAEPGQETSVGQPVHSASRGPEVEIYSPTQWVGDGTDTATVAPKQSIRVIGLARYAAGIVEVLANNARLSLARVPNNPDVVQFSGFVGPPPAGSDGEVEILARGRDGSQAVRTFKVRTAEVEASGPARFENIAEAARRQRWAVIIGVSTYEDPTIPNLRYADDDARAVYDFFRSPEAGMGGIPENHIRLLINEQATARNIRSALTTFLRQSTPDDVVFLYIAGHGAPDPYRPNDLYILTHDTEIDNIAGTAVSMEDVNDGVQQAYAYNKVVLADVGHSAGVGSGGRSLNQNTVNAAFLDHMNASAGGFVAFTASESNQLSQEGVLYGGGHGVFTYYFLDGLHGAADAVENGGDGDHVVTLGEAMEYTRDRVRRATRNAQIPAISLTSYDRFWPMAVVTSH